MDTRADAPTFSIVIPTYDRPDLVRRLLSALSRLDYPAERFEVIVVDDGSPRPLHAVIAEFVDRLDVRLIRQRNAGPATARNRGAGEARGQWLAFTDDDCVPERGWLNGLERALLRDSEVAVGGRLLSYPEDTVYSVASQNLVEYLYHYYNRPDSSARFFSSANLACARDLFLATGGFNESFRIAAAEDRDICDRWCEQGRRLVFAGNAVVRHAPRLTFRRFVRQHFNYGRGALCLHRARELRGVSRPRREPLRFYFGLLVYPIGRGFGLRTPQLVALALTTQIVYVLGFLSERSLTRKTPPAAAEARKQDATDPFQNRAVRRQMADFEHEFIRH